MKLGIPMVAVIGFLALSTCGRQTSSQSPAHLQDLTDSPFWQTSRPQDQTLDRGHSLYPYFLAAKQKNLPLAYFRDLIAAQASVAFKPAEWPSCRSFWGWWTVYHPMIGKSFTEWNRSEWASFYNEIFSVWYNVVFLKSPAYAYDRAKVLTSERYSHYQRANPSQPRLAQEEGYSETINGLMIMLYPQYNSATGQNSRYFTLDHYKYDTNRTVAPVSHSDRPGYTPAAESTYMNNEEYRILFRQLLGVEPPSNLVDLEKYNTGESL